jgi:hypothetical protein
VARRRAQEERSSAERGARTGQATRSALALLVLTAACVPSGRPAEGPLDATTADTAGPTDVGPADDAGGPSDSAIDAGATPADAGPPVDVGFADLGPRPDAGPPPSGPRLRLIFGGRDVANHATLDLGAGPVGQPLTGTLVLENVWSEPVRLIGTPTVELGGLDADRFTVTVDDTVELAPGARLEIGLASTPDALGRKSADLVIRTDAPIPAVIRLELSAAGRGTSLYVAVGSAGHRARSLDGRTWTNDVWEPGAGLDDDQLLRGVGYGNGVYVAVGGSAVGRIMVSSDGIQWDEVSDDLGWIGSVAYGNGWFVAAGGNTRYLRSRNGREWVNKSNVNAGAFRDIVFGGGKFVAVGDSGRRIVTLDGEVWTDDQSGGPTLRSVAWGDGVFVAVGDDARRIRSVDGITWTDDQRGGFELTDVAWGNGRFVAVDGPFARVSTDGRTWTQHDAPFVVRLAYGDGQFVGMGERGGFYVSADGTGWTQVGQTISPHGFLNVTWGDGT